MRQFKIMMNENLLSKQYVMHLIDSVICVNAEKCHSYKLGARKILKIISAFESQRFFYSCF